MFFSAAFDLDQWMPRPDEGAFEYWLSLNPMAPFFGVPYRFGRIQVHAPLKARGAAPKVSPIRPETADEAVVVETPAPAPDAAEPKASVAPEPAAAVVDDLTAIKGIGPKMAAKLNALGVTSYAQIAGWSAETVAEMDAALGGLPGAIARADWVGQARSLAG